jgi:hypothetical protein
MLLSNVTPAVPIRSRVCGITRIDSTVWSSVMMTTIFGRAMTVATDPAALPERAVVCEGAN